VALVHLNITASYGNAVGGTVTFDAGDVWRIDQANNMIWHPERVVASVQDDGTGTGIITAQLLGSDDPAFTYSYTVRDEIVADPDQQPHIRTYTIVLPAAADGSTIDLADVQPDGTVAADQVGPPSDITV
jgi:hypothetical protein